MPGKRGATESRAQRNWKAIGNTEDLGGVRGAALHGDRIVLVLSHESSDHTLALAAGVEQLVGGRPQ
jgi:hypothetical protein